MKSKNILLFTLFLVAGLSLLSSCGEDRWPEYAAKTERDRWMDSIMRVNYLWYDELAAESKLNFFNAPTAFIKSAVPSKDKGFTTADSIVFTPTLSYGYAYKLNRAATDATNYNALITYILPNSPAADAGLKRGDYIMQVNGEEITTKNETALLGGTDALELVIGKYTEQVNENETVTGIVVEDRTASMPAAREVENNPVNYYNTYTRGGYKVGYMVYSKFTAGTISDPEKYNNELRALSNTFKAAGASIIILDLRYNGGGQTECAQLLGTLLAPASLLGTPMAYLEYNDMRQDQNQTLLFDNALIKEGSNLNTEMIIVLSTTTTGGASEMIMNCLNGKGIGVQLIGQKTVGQNVGTNSYRNPKTLWQLNLVEYTIYNSNHESEYTTGISPNYTIDETQDLLHFLPFGDENETLLNAALEFIENDTYPSATE